ncbi:hypothetical protein BKA81DRAFT_357277 [Phyllosticta paracitricarpa]
MPKLPTQKSYFSMAATVCSLMMGSVSSYVSPTVSLPKMPAKSSFGEPCFHVKLPSGAQSLLSDKLNISPRASAQSACVRLLVPLVLLSGGQPDGWTTKMLLKKKLGKTRTCCVLFVGPRRSPKEDHGPSLPSLENVSVCVRDEIIFRGFAPCVRLLRGFGWVDGWMDSTYHSPLGSKVTGAGISWASDQRPK